MIYKRILIIAFVLGTLALGLVGCDSNNATSSTTTDSFDASTQSEILSEVTAVIKSIDAEGKSIVAVDVNSNQEYSFIYHGGVDIQNKYGDIMSVNQVELGDIVDITYNSETYKMQAMYMNKDAWELKDVKGLNIDRVNSTIKADNETYKLSDDILAFYKNESIDILEIVKEDQVVLKGYQGKLCSISVILGHGYVKLKDYDTYIGGMIEIGNDTIVPVTEDMLITVMEGEYKLKINKGGNSGYKNIVVKADEEVEVSLLELQIAPEKTGALRFVVEPEGARVYIDGTLIDTSSDYEVIYGKHRIIIYATGYTTYKGYIVVDEPLKTREYKLSTSEEEAGDNPTESEGSDDDGKSDGTKTNNKININSPTGVMVYVDGVYVGVAPVSVDKTVGEHTITLSASGYITKSYTINCVNNGQDDNLKYDSLTTISNLIE